MIQSYITKMGIVPAGEDLHVSNNTISNSIHKIVGVQHMEWAPQLLAAASVTTKNFRNVPYLNRFWVNLSEVRADVIAFISN